MAVGTLLGVCSLAFAEPPEGLWYVQPFFTVTRQADAGAPAGTGLRERFRDLDGDDVLSRLARLPIREWSVKGQDPAIRHLGPAAQDFRVAFGLGDKQLPIDPADADGVALRSIQALEVRSRTQHEHMLADTQALANEIESLVRLTAERAAEVAALKSELATFRAEVAALRRGRR